MVKRILSFLNKELTGVNEAALLLGGFAFVSQLLGLVRDRTLAHIIGPGPTLDIYYAAFRIPDFLYLSVASLASITVLMPFLMGKLSDKANGKEDARRFLNNVFSAYMLFMLVVSVIVAICMPYIARAIAPGFTSTQLALLVTTSRIMLFSPIFIGLSNLIGTVTQIFKNFFVFSLSPIFYNFGILFGIFFFYPHYGVYGLAGGVILGAILHLSVQIPTIVSHGFFPKFRPINWHEILDVVKLSAPRTFTLSCNSLAFLGIIAIASTLKSGSISLFTFAYNLQSVPVGIIGISYSVAAFPTLVRSYSGKNTQGFIDHIMATSRQVIFWSLPVITLMIVLRAQIVRVVLGSNTFSWSDTRLTAASVALFVVSLISQSLVLLFVRGYYAAGNTKKPLLVNVFSSTMMIVFAYTFIYIFKTYPDMLMSLSSLLRVKDVHGTILLALPLAYTFASLLNFFLIWILFKKDFLKGGSSKLFPTFMQVAIGSLVMGVSAYIALGFFDDIFTLHTARGVFLQGFCSGIFGICLGAIALALMKNKELIDLISTLNSKLRHKGIIAPEQDVL
jgi:putative peptidoglycan lipid II flippase